MSGRIAPPWDRLDPGLGGRPYERGEDLLSEHLIWLDLLLETALALRGEGVRLPGTALTGEELGAAFSDSLLERRRDPLPPEIAAALQAGETYLLGRALASVDAGLDLPLTRLFTVYRANPLERLALLMALAPLEHRKYAYCYVKLQGSAALTWPSDLLVRSLYGLYAREAPGEALDLCESGSTLRRTLFEPHTDGTLQLRRWVWLWLHGSGAQEPGVALFCRRLAPSQAPILVNHGQYETLRHHVERGAPALFQLSGRPGSGRRFFLRRLSAELGREILSVDLGALCAYPQEDRVLLLDRLEPECRLKDCLLHLHGWPEQGEEGLEWVFSRLAELSPMLFLSTERSRTMRFPAALPVVILTLDELSLTQRLGLWQAQAERVPMDETLDLALCAAQYRLTPGSIQRACDEALAAALGEGRATITAADLQPCVYRGVTARLEEMSTRVPPVFRRKDLMLPPDQNEILDLARDRLRLGRQVDEEWGFDEKLAYGRGLSLLLCGPPGTGKTMTAQVLAAEVGLELFRVDMSQLTSKYIGESEKNISRIFDAARDSNVILFFDEADSLFAKRTEVHSSNDRHANAEVAFLLQKMEEYQGMCILSTNLIQNFDEAFFRRLTFVVRFQMPDAEQRLALWESAFPARAPMGDDLNLKVFADALEFSGSAIKAAAYNAAYLAAVEGTEISRRHLLQAVRMEHAKMGRLFLPGELRG